MTAHTHKLTPHAREKYQGFMALPGDFAAAAAVLQKPHAALSAVLDQQRHFLEHLCFSWRSLISILTRPDVAYLQ